MGTSLSNPFVPTQGPIDGLKVYGVVVVVGVSESGEHQSRRFLIVDPVSEQTIEEAIKPCVAEMATLLQQSGSE